MIYILSVRAIDRRAEYYSNSIDKLVQRINKIIRLQCPGNTYTMKPNKYRLIDLG